MPSNRRLPKFFLILGSLSLVLLLVFQNRIRNFVSFNVEKAKIYKENFFAAGNPEVMKRPRPITTTQKESELEVYIGGPFNNFSPEEWQEFWNIIYGLYERGQPPEPGLPKKMRQLTPDEIIQELRKRYPQPFAYFTREYWDGLFDIIYSK